MFHRVLIGMTSSRVASVPATVVVGDDVARDPEHPAGDSLLIPDLVRAPVDAEKHLLQQVVSGRHVANTAAKERAELVAEGTRDGAGDRGGGRRGLGRCVCSDQSTRHGS